MKWLFALLMLSLTACFVAQKPPGTVRHPFTVIVHTDKAFTEEERFQVVAAADTWNAQTDGLANLEVVFDLDMNGASDLLHLARNHVLLLRMPEDTDVVEYLDEDSGGRVLGAVTPSGGALVSKEARMIIVADRLPDSPTFRRVALHEFGHLLGLPHVPEPTGIMYPSTGPVPEDKMGTVCLRLPDIAEFCRVHDCSGANPTHCSGK